MGKLRWVVHSDASYAAGVSVCWATVKLRGYEGRMTPANDPMRTPHHVVTVTRSSGGAHAAEILAAASGLAFAKRLEILRMTGGAPSRATSMLVTDSVGAIRTLEGKAPADGLRARIAQHLISDLDWNWGRKTLYRHAVEIEVRDQDRFAKKLRSSLGREWTVQDIEAAVRQICSLPIRRETSDGLMEVRLVEQQEVQAWLNPEIAPGEHAPQQPNEDELLIHHALRLNGRLLMEIAAPAVVTLQSVRDYAKAHCAHQFDGHAHESVRQWFDEAEIESIPIGLLPRSSQRMQALYARYGVIRAPES